MFTISARRARLTAVIVTVAAGLVAFASAASAHPGMHNTARGVVLAGLVNAGPFVESNFPDGPGVLPTGDTDSVLSIGADPLFSSDAVNTFAGPDSATASIVDMLAAFPPDTDVTAELVSSECSAGTPPTGSASIVEGQIAQVGLPPIVLSANPAPNTAVVVPDVASLILNRQTINPDGSLTVDAIYISLLPGTPAAQTFTIASSTCQAAVLQLLEPATYTIEVGDCPLPYEPAPGSPTVPVTFDITPPGSVVVTVNGPGGPYQADTDGQVLNLAPGDYTAIGTPTVGFSVATPTRTFSVQACPDTSGPGSVTVTVEACPATSSEGRPVRVVIFPPNAAQVTISGPGGFQQAVSGAGSLGALKPGTYTYVATFQSFIVPTGPTQGSFTVGSCLRLPATGADVTGLAGVGLAGLVLGLCIVALTRRQISDGVSS